MTDSEKNLVDLFNRLFLIENKWQNVFYMHTPFCLRKCNYCVYGSKVPSSKEELNTFYHKIIPRQIEQYKHTLENVKFDQVYFGGGTPTVGDADILAGIYEQIPNFKDIPLKTTEASPHTITEEHIDLFGQYGFRYVSLGVQTLDKRVLEKENRFVVNRAKLNYIFRQLDRYDIISNTDLIFFLDTDTLKDLEISRNDLDIMMSSIRPVSLTLYSNYRAKKSVENRRGMINVIKEMLEKYPEYRCVNSCLDEAELAYDMENSVEYRLMRKHQDFNFYMLSKVPQSHPHGHNMLAVGEYMHFKPRYNYYFVYDFMDKYTWKDYYNYSKAICEDYERTREKLGLPHSNLIKNHGFFKDENSKNKFKEILKETGNPYHEL
ncbi:MAG: radical SAM protein [Candidatus Aminicenantes bacterium]|nr:radical SAM protein [Candidatus Aminicenantes bacterium]